MEAELKALESVLGQPNDLSLLSLAVLKFLQKLHYWKT